MSTTTTPDTTAADEEAKKKKAAEEEAAKKKKAEEGEEKEGGIGGFLQNNMGMLAGGLLGAALMFMTGGSGIMAFLIPLIGALIGGMMDGDGSMLGGIKNALFGSGKEKSEDPSKDGPGKKKETEAPGTEKTTEPEKTLPQVIVANGAQVQLKSGEQVITGVDDKGAATYGAPTGTPPRGSEISMIERAPAVEGAGDPGAQYRYTGYVQGDKFVVTSVASIIPGSNPPEFGNPVKMDTKDPAKPELALPIGADGKVNLTAAPESDLAKARTKASDRAKAYNTETLLDVKETGIGVVAPGNPMAVTAETEAVVRDGKTYVTRLEGTRDANGVITFNKASVMERTVDADGKVTDTPVKDPQTGVSSFDIPPISGGQINGAPPKVSIKTGVLENLRESGADYAVQLKEQDKQMTEARGKDLVAAINAAPNAEQAMTSLAKRFNAQLKAGGLDEMSAAMASNAVADYYSDPANRTADLDQVKFKEFLKGKVDPSKIDAITAEVAKQNGQIVAAIDAKPMAKAPGADPAAPEVKAKDQKINRDLAYNPPSAGDPVAPTPVPGVGTPTTAAPSK